MVGGKNWTRASQGGRSQLRGHFGFILSTLGSQEKVPAEEGQMDLFFGRVAQAAVWGARPAAGRPLPLSVLTWRQVRQREGWRLDIWEVRQLKDVKSEGGGARMKLCPDVSAIEGNKDQ